MTDPVDYFRITESEPLPDISAYAPFRAVVIINGPYSVEWQDRVSDWLVASGCLYMLAWGENCTSWDDSVDYANMRQFPFDEIPDEHFVLTTWHDKEPLDEVLWFAGFGAQHGDVDLKYSLLIDIGKENRRAELLARWDAARDSCG
jgi:hypothetical protein